MSSGQKGVMLCERPGPSPMDSSPGPKPFLPSSNPSGLEPLGLVPTQKSYPPSLAPKLPNINLRDQAAVRSIEEDVRLATLQVEERRLANAAKAESVSTFGAQLRAAILSGDDVSFWRAAKQAEGIKQAVETSKARAAAAVASSSSSKSASAATAAASATTRVDAGTSKEAMMSFVDEILREANSSIEKSPSPSPSPSPMRADATWEASTSGAAVSAPAIFSTPRRKGRNGSSKPAWALTEEQVSKLEDAEEEELLKFADDLDFDSFMAALDDPELQESVKAGNAEGGKGPAPGEEKAWRRNLVRAMNHVAMKRVTAAAAAWRNRTAAADEEDDLGSVAVVSDGGASSLTRATVASKLKSDAGTTKRTALSEVKAGGGDGGWDGSSRAADDVARMERAKAATMEAFEFLRENPELRAVHSPASVRALIGKVDAAMAES